MASVRMLGAARYGSIAVMFRFGTWPTGILVTSRSAL